VSVRVIDISQPLAPGIAVWPGDRPFELDWTLRRAAGDPVNVAAIALSVHTGTHLDGFRHVTDDGATAGEMPLHACIGPAAVVDARGHRPLGPGLLDRLDPGRTPRVLFRTRESVDTGDFPEDFAWIAPELAHRLVRDGFRLAGTDAPSIDPLDSRELPSHHVLVAGGVVNIENLVLTAVPPGDYILIALPLRLTTADSSPVRAVLLDGAWA
jgi:arylformamidase